MRFILVVRNRNLHPIQTAIAKEFAGSGGIGKIIGSSRYEHSGETGFFEHDDTWSSESIKWISTENDIIWVTAPETREVV